MVHARLHGAELGWVGRDYNLVEAGCWTPIHNTLSCSADIRFLSVAARYGYVDSFSTLMSSSGRRCMEPFIGGARSQNIDGSGGQNRNRS